MSDKDRRAALLADIVERQQRGRLLSEIGDALGSREIVRAAVLAWLSAPNEPNGNKRAQQCTTGNRERTLRWHGVRTTPQLVP
jgi:hypothetical protein